METNKKSYHMAEAFSDGCSCGGRMQEHEHTRNYAVLICDKCSAKQFFSTKTGLRCSEGEYWEAQRIVRRS